MIIRYGITVDDYDKMFSKQGGVCAICHQEETSRDRNGFGERGVRRLAVDHDKETGTVRGLLCAACNMGIGSLGHSQERMRSAISYLGAS